MDLHNIDNYLRPTDINKVTAWGKNWSWLAGGTWLFSEPQPDVKTLVDIQAWGWDEIEVNSSSEGGLLTIGATCPLIKLLKHPWLSEYIAVEGFKAAISALAASLKVVNMATVGGNICLALSVGTLAPMMVALDASYEIWNLQGKSRIVAAKDFQIASRHTVLQSGELLRRVLIPVEHLKWQVDYKRFGMAASDPALAIVVGAYNEIANKMRLVIAASVVAPVLLEFDHNLDSSLDYITSVENMDFIEDARAIAIYRRQVTQVLIKRCFNNFGF
ncbi:FAD binding domain-containing protein [Rivularia sp. UHCC 0363]|uniref:FAD binding domain-containing protein n=1 Tax=Rivularia sp. UHCC 0363 TaxID=3110244 RepID=UPI002B1FC11A|nr:FAD binding domain-containing protein [Rivularia sp. UHCC 0363]MEA5595636.1 FAD binding domain-containing protein [Rivularia sp. UHCC 0363]